MRIWLIYSHLSAATGSQTPAQKVCSQRYLIKFPRMLRVSSLVMVEVALRVALFTIFSPVEVLEVFFLPVTLEVTESATAAAAPSSSRLRRRKISTSC